MNTFYIISLVITAGLSVLMTLVAPTLVLRYRQQKRRKKQKLNELIAAEVERQLNNVPEERERNQRAKIRKEVDWYLNELRND